MKSDSEMFLILRIVGEITYKKIGENGVDGKKQKLKRMEGCLCDS